MPYRHDKYKLSSKGKFKHLGLNKTETRRPCNNDGDFNRDKNR